jgi:hypothetical protein
VRRATSDAVHGDSNGLVSLSRDGSQGHATRAEAPHDLLCRLHLLDGHGRPDRSQLQAIPQHRDWATLKVFLVRRVHLLHKQPNMKPCSTEQRDNSHLT